MCIYSITYRFLYHNKEDVNHYQTPASEICAELFEGKCIPSSIYSDLSWSNIDEYMEETGIDV